MRWVGTAGAVGGEEPVDPVSEEGGRDRGWEGPGGGVGGVLREEGGWVGGVSDGDGDVHGGLGAWVRLLDLGFCPRVVRRRDVVGLTVRRL